MNTSVGSNEKDDIIAAGWPAQLATCPTANAIRTSPRLTGRSTGRRRMSPAQKGDHSVNRRDSLFHCSLSERPS